ncbi:hypothetical protein DSO57_1015180 [Entomophthora muscae]|uniref:Uncharacterized protein n=1 Tax=Entomophthora muscae TaxID=34485 RepID=A0ACC2RK01_9FUNG|nr:hypothetical protein DSO57_1015180 [Entomophthora muscae]
MFLICLLALVQCVRTVELFGGGCLVEEGKLTISGAFRMQDDDLIADSIYQLALNMETKLKEDNVIDWKPVLSSYTLPGEFREFTYQTEPYPAYILGGLARRNLNYEDGGEEPDEDQLRKIYLEALNNGLDVGIFQDNKYTLFLDPENPHNLGTISIVEGGNFTFKPTSGSIPSYAKGFSAAHHRDSVYIVDSDHVYVFDLKTSTWNSHRVTGLVAARNGCLYLHDTTLIHAFGKPPKTDLTLLIILAISTLALLIPVAIYGFIRFRNHRNTLPPPQFYTERIWVDHTISTCSLDYNLNSDPISSFDKTLVPTTSNTPLSPNNIFDY